MAANTRRRQIGRIGTAARVVLGVAFLVLGLTGGRVSVMHGQVGIGFEPLSVAVGLVGFPAVVLAWQWLRAHIDSNRLQATGPGSTAVNMLVLVALLLTPVVRTAAVLHQCRSACLLRGLDVAGGASRLRRMRGDGYLKLDSRQGRPGWLPCAQPSGPPGAPHDGLLDGRS